MDTIINSEKKLNICVFGTGSFGTALATVAARAGHDITIVGRTVEIIDEINEFHTNQKYFGKDLKIPNNVKATTNKEVIRNCDYIIHALPVQVTLSVLEQAKEYIKDGTPILIASKGILLKQKKFISEVWDEIFPKERNIQHLVISGPSFAIELMKDFPSVVTLACRDLELAKFIQHSLSHGTFRVYTTDDVIGVEIGGALKNVIAIMAGLIEGLGYRFNTISACVTRGVFELSLFSQHFGGRMETLNGLSGIGDIMLSALGDLSRNKKVGLNLAKGQKIDDIINQALEVAEGVPTLKVLHEIIVENKLKMPLCDTIYKVVYEDMPLDEAKNYIMQRPLEEETEMRIRSKTLEKQV